MQVFVIALDFSLGALGTGRPHDQARALRHVDFLCDFLQLLAVGRIGDLAADATAARGVRHQDAVPTGQRKISRQGSALVAALLLDDLHQHDLADLHDFLDLVLAGLGALNAGGANFGNIVVARYCLDIVGG